METTNAKAVFVQVAHAILETIKEAGDEGAPSGVVYLACSEMGMSLHQYEQIIEGFMSLGAIERRNHVLYYKRK